MYRKLSLSIIDNFAIFLVIDYRFFVAKLSIIHDNSKKKNSSSISKEVTTIEIGFAIFWPPEIFGF
jgi:hypothetical protein